MNFWVADEPTWVYLVGLTVLHLVAQEVFKRWGPFKADPGVMAHQVRVHPCTLDHRYRCTFYTTP